MKYAMVKTFSIFILFTIAGLLVYSNTLEAPFIFDDANRIQKNHAIRMTELSFSNILKVAFGKNTASNRPVGNLSFALNYYFHRYNLKGYHILNILIHISAGLLLYSFLKTTLTIHRDAAYEKKLDTECKSPPDIDIRYTNIQIVVFFSSLIWLVHPLHTQSVTYIVQRLNSMAAMFFLLSFSMYVKARLVQRRQLSFPVKENKSQEQSSPSPKMHYLWFSGSAVAWIMALGSKQIAATLPFLIFLYEYYFFQGLDRNWIRKSLKYLFAVFLLFSIIAFVYLGLNPLEKIYSLKDFANREFTFSERLLTQPRVVIYYLSLLFYPNPSRLNLDHDFTLSNSLINPITTLFSIGAIIGLLCLACFLAKKERLISFSIIWFLGNLVIESSIIPLAIIFEHRTYLPSMLTVLPVVILVYRFIKYPRIASGFFCIVIIIFAIWTYQRNHVWRDGAVLWTDSISKSPGKARPYNNLGVALEDKGLLDKAIGNYHQALGINPDYIDAYINLGSALNQKGDTNEAIKNYLHALHLAPDNPKVHYNLGIALEDTDQSDEAIKHYSQALNIQPNYSNARVNLGIALAQKGRLDEAIQHFTIALKMEPDSFDLHNNLGNTLNQKGLLDEAIKHYSIALQIDPDYLYGHINLGVALSRKGRFDEAIERFSIALQIDPDSFDVHSNLGNALSQKKQFDDAIEHYLRALSINPDSANTYNNLGLALARKGDVREAIDKFKEALRIDPDFTEASNNLEQVLNQIK